jgi:hypothetical protein
MVGKQQVQMRTREVEVEPEANDSERMKGDLTSDEERKIKI